MVTLTGPLDGHRNGATREQRDGGLQVGDDAGNGQATASFLVFGKSLPIAIA